MKILDYKDEKSKSVFRLSVSFSKYNQPIGQEAADEWPITVHREIIFSCVLRNWKKKGKKAEGKYQIIKK